MPPYKRSILAMLLPTVTLAIFSGTIARQHNLSGVYGKSRFGFEGFFGWHA